MRNEEDPTGQGPTDRTSGLSAEEKGNLRKAAIFVIAAIGFILGLKFLLGY